jgi:1,4-alpha-glucan branching enzyme
VSRLSDEDLYLFNEGSHLELYRKLGAHPGEVEGAEGCWFAVWAPAAERVAAIGDFNDWDPAAHPLEPRGSSGVWEGFVPGAEPGDRYKYHVVSREEDYRVEKADPFGLRHEEPPRTASVIWEPDYQWGDDAWMEERADRQALDAPTSIYEVHLGSWRRHEDGSFLSYRELAPRLGEYVEEMGFTHVELLPVMEHPFYASWGYQTTGYFAPTARYGGPEDFMYLVDHLHQRGIGVILDWVPSHFPSDEHGLAYFDGTHLFEHADPRQGLHPDWDSLIFNYGRHEVRSFLLSSGLFWLDAYHADGLRVDAVASMLYRDYSREEGEWVPNVHGGRENLEAISLLQELNEEAYGRFPGVQTFAEESTAYPMVSRPTDVGGLGFGYKWDMGWMHDTLEYLGHEPVHRKYHHNEITFRAMYAFSENYVLPLSHDEVVHGKRSLLDKMPGDEWQMRANLRLLLGYMFAQPGKKLLFMGAELGQWREWHHDRSLDWDLLEEPGHRGIQEWVKALNRAYAEQPALHERDCDAGGFEWVDASDVENSVLAFLRRGGNGEETVLAVCNFTPVPRPGYRIGVPRAGRWEVLLDSDAERYGGSGHADAREYVATEPGHHGRSWSVELTLPPLGILLLAPGGES